MTFYTTPDNIPYVGSTEYSNDADVPDLSEDMALRIQVVFASVRSQLQSYADAIIPVGTITAYGGTAAPAGWHLCNGTSHGSSALTAVIGSSLTPNLTDRFVVGAGTSYSRGATGGANTVGLSSAESGLRDHTHPVWSDWMNQNNTHAHSASSWTDAQGQHAHNVYTNEGSDQTGNDGQMLDTVPNWQGSYPQTGWTDAQGNHGHNVGTSVGGADINHGHTIYMSGSGTLSAAAAHENRPPYYALVYIIKKGPNGT